VAFSGPAASDLYDLGHRSHVLHVLSELYEMGCPVSAGVYGIEELYKTLGFRKSTEYVYLNGNQISGTHSENIRKIKDSDYEAILRIDQEVTGEYRPQIIEPYLTNGFVFEEDTEVQGFFLPELGNGLIIAATDKAGLYLLQYKHGQQEYTAVIPKGNHTAIDFLYQNGFEEVNRVNRMYMGNEVLWKPEKIFARGTKYGG